MTWTLEHEFPDLLNEHKRASLQGVFAELMRELTNVESLAYTAAGALQAENIAENQQHVTEMAADKAYRLRMNLEVLDKALHPDETGNAGGVE